MAIEQASTALADAPKMGVPSKVDDPMQDSSQETKLDYGPNNENLPKALQTRVTNLARRFNDEDKFSRRLEIQTSKKAHWFYRSLQHIGWDARSEGWVAIGPNGAPLVADSSGRIPYNSDSAILYTTNIHQAYGLTLMAVLTQSIPKVIAMPEDPEDAADVLTAKAGSRIRKMIEHENDATTLLTEAMFFAYVDGRSHAWTRAEEGQNMPRISVHGSLEVKVPITAKCQEEMLYVQFSRERHIAFEKSENPKFADQIRGGAQGGSQDMYERTARLSVAQGTSYMSGSGDTLENLATEQQTWMLPAAFELDRKNHSDPDPELDEIERLFPSGCRVKIVSGEYVGSWDESHLECWKILNAMPGDGQFRNSLGYSTESVNERFNDIINITQDIYEKTQPASYWDVEMFGTDGTVRQTSMPGAHYPVKAKPGQPVSESVFFEPAASVSPDMLSYGQDLMGPVPQFLTGAFPALFGGGEAKGAAGDTASGYAMQRDQAMGRMGLVFRATKRWWAGVMGQAVKCAGKSAKDLTMAVPDAKGNVETTKVRMEELKGDVHWYPESDEGFPENWMQQRATYMQLLSMADANPLLVATLAEPENQEIGQRLIGLNGFKIAGADSWTKQMLEINEMVDADPVPNPKFEQMRMEHMKLQMAAQQGPVPDEAITALAQESQGIQPMSPSIPIDEECDDHAAEMKAGMGWINGMEGQKAKAEKPQGFMNVRLHVLLHKAALQKQMAAMQPPPGTAPARHGAPGAKAPAAQAAS